MNYNLRPMRGPDVYLDGMEADWEILNGTFVRHWIDYDGTHRFDCAESPPRPGTGSLYYRAKPAFDAATDWLRAQGLDIHHPLHALRKEFGSLINRTFGLAAAEALGHSSVRVTAGYCVSAKERIEAGINLDPAK